LADQPWWAAAAMPISATAPHSPDIIGVKTIGTTQRAQISIAVFRALLTDQPRLIKLDDSQTPPTLPISAIREIVMKGGPIVERSSPCLSFRKLGIQNR